MSLTEENKAIWVVGSDEKNTAERGQPNLGQRPYLVDTV